MSAAILPCKIEHSANYYLTTENGRKIRNKKLALAPFRTDGQMLRARWR